MPSNIDTDCGEGKDGNAFQTFLVRFESGAYKFLIRDGPLDERLGTPRNFKELGLFCFDAATLLVLFCLLVFLVQRLIRDSGEPFRQRLRRERWFWALQKTLTQSYIQFVPLFLLLAAVDEYIIEGNFLLRTTKELVLLLWAFLLTNSWTLALDPLGRTFLVVQPIRYYGLRAIFGLTVALGGWALSMAVLSSAGGGGGRDLAHQARDSVVIVRVWLVYLSVLTALGATYSAYQLYVFKVLRRTITRTRGLFIKRFGGEFDSGILLALVDAQRNTPTRMPGLPRKVLRLLRLELEARALSHLEVVTALILANAAAKLTVLGLQLYLIEMALPGDKNEDNSSEGGDNEGGLRSTGSLEFARLTLHCVSLRLLNFVCVALESLPMGYFLACLRTPKCPVAEILIPTRRRASLTKAASNTAILYAKMAKLFRLGHGDIQRDGDQSTHTAPGRSFLTTTEMMKVSGVLPPPPRAPPISLSAFLTGAPRNPFPENLDHDREASSLTVAPEPLRDPAACLGARSGDSRGVTGKEGEEVISSSGVSPLQLFPSAPASATPSPQPPPAPALSDLYYAFHGSSSPEAVAAAQGVGSLPFWEFCRSRDVPRGSKNLEPALLHPAWHELALNKAKAEAATVTGRTDDGGSVLSMHERLLHAADHNFGTQSQSRLSTVSSVAYSSTSSLASDAPVYPSTNHSAPETHTAMDEPCFSDDPSSEPQSQRARDTRPATAPTTTTTTKRRRRTLPRKPKQPPSCWVELDVSLLEMVLFHRSKNLAVGALFTGHRSFIVINTRTRRLRHTNAETTKPGAPSPPSDDDVGENDNGAPFASAPSSTPQLKRSPSVETFPPKEKRDRTREFDSPGTRFSRSSSSSSSGSSSSEDDGSGDDFEGEDNDNPRLPPEAGIIGVSRDQNRFRSFSTVVGDELTRWATRDSFSAAQSDLHHVAPGTPPPPPFAPPPKWVRSSKSSKTKKRKKKRAWEDVRVARPRKSVPWRGGDEGLSPDTSGHHQASHPSPQHRPHSSLQFFASKVASSLMAAIRNSCRTTAKTGVVERQREADDDKEEGSRTGGGRGLTLCGQDGLRVSKKSREEEEKKPGAGDGGRISGSAAKANDEHGAAARSTQDAEARKERSLKRVSRRFEWSQWTERGRSDVTSHDASDPHFSLTSLVPQPKSGQETEVRIDVYNIDPHSRSAFDEIAVERESLQDHALLATATFNLDALRAQREGGTEYGGGGAEHASEERQARADAFARASTGLLLVEDPDALACHPPPLLHLPLRVRRYFNKHGNRWQRVGGIAEVSARFLRVNPWSMGTFQSPHPLGVISRGFSLSTAQEEWHYSRDNFLGFRTDDGFASGYHHDALLSDEVDRQAREAETSRRGGHNLNDPLQSSSVVASLPFATERDRPSFVDDETALGMEAGDANDPSSSSSSLPSHAPVAWQTISESPRRAQTRRSVEQQDVLMRPFDVSPPTTQNARSSSSSSRPPRRLLVREEMLESPFSLVIPKLMLRLTSFDRRRDAERCRVLHERVNHAVATGVAPPFMSPDSPELTPSSQVARPRATSSTSSSLLPPVTSSHPGLDGSSVGSQQAVNALTNSVKRRAVNALEWISELEGKYRDLAASTDALYAELSPQANVSDGASEEGWKFKKSALKASAPLRFHPTNLHLQVMAVTASASVDRHVAKAAASGFDLEATCESLTSASPLPASALHFGLEATPETRSSASCLSDSTTIRRFEVVTVGCFAAHSLKLNKGPSGAGVFQLRQLLSLRLQLLEDKHERLVERCRQGGGTSGGAEMFLATHQTFPAKRSSFHLEHNGASPSINLSRHRHLGVALSVERPESANRERDAFSSQSNLELPSRPQRVDENPTQHNDDHGEARESVDIYIHGDIDAALRRSDSEWSRRSSSFSTRLSASSATTTFTRGDSRGTVRQSAVISGGHLDNDDDDDRDGADNDGHSDEFDLEDDDDDDFGDGDGDEEDDLDIVDDESDDDEGDDVEGAGSGNRRRRRLRPKQGERNSGLSIRSTIARSSRLSTHRLSTHAVWPQRRSSVGSSHGSSSASPHPSNGKRSRTRVDRRSSIGSAGSRGGSEGRRSRSSRKATTDRSRSFNSSLARASTSSSVSHDESTDHGTKRASPSSRKKRTEDPTEEEIEANANPLWQKPTSGTESRSEPGKSSDNVFAVAGSGSPRARITAGDEPVRKRQGESAQRNSSRWVEEDQEVGDEGGGKKKGASEPTLLGSEGQSTTDTALFSASSPPLPPPPPPPRGWLPSGWKRHIDPRTGDPFYANATTQETSWTPPPGSGETPEEFEARQNAAQEVEKQLAALEDGGGSPGMTVGGENGETKAGTGNEEDFEMEDDKVGLESARGGRGLTAAERDLSCLPLDRKLHELEFKLRQRSDVVFSQAVAAVATAVAYRIELALGAASSTGKPPPTAYSSSGSSSRDRRCDNGEKEVKEDHGQEMLKKMHRVGLLLSFESLLSTTGKEAAMLSDFYGAVLELDHLSLLFRPFDEHKVSKYLPSHASRAGCLNEQGDKVGNQSSSAPGGVCQQEREAVSELSPRHESRKHSSKFSPPPPSSSSSPSLLIGLHGRRRADSAPSSLEGSSSAYCTRDNDGPRTDHPRSGECIFVERMAQGVPNTEQLIQGVALIRLTRSSSHVDSFATPFDDDKSVEDGGSDDGEDDDDDEEESGGVQGQKSPRRPVNGETRGGGLCLIFLLSRTKFDALPQELKGTHRMRGQRRQRRAGSSMSDGAMEEEQDRISVDSSDPRSSASEGNDDRENRSEECSNGGLIRLFPVMFSQGINEQQTFANAMGFGGFQEAINLAGVMGLRRYLNRLTRYWRRTSSSQSSTAARASRDKAAHTLSAKLAALETSVEEARGSGKKHFEVLTESSMLARRMGGLRFTSCKSAKDRTGMAVTLEQARLLRTHYNLSTETCDKAIHLMRLHGTRLANARKNIGRPTYAFNGLQLQMLPRAYRPPVVVAGKVAS